MAAATLQQEPFVEATQPKACEPAGDYDPWGP